jgi:iron complex transport system substrate-binding protein
VPNTAQKSKASLAGYLALGFAVQACVLLFPVHLSAERVFEDQLGRQVRLPSVPTRIVSLAPNITEILYALDLDDRISGVTEFSNYPEAAKEKPKVGTYVAANLETIVSLKPDLIIGTFGGTRKETVSRLEGLGYPVFVTKSENMEAVMVMIEKIGMITDREQEATALATGLRRRIKAVVDAVSGAPRPLVFLQINAKPLMTVGRGAFHDEMISLAGGANLAGQTDARYPPYSIEDVVKRGPDYILISTMNRSGLFEEQKAEWMRWTNIPAVKNHRVLFVDSNLIDRASPRIVDGVEEVARLIHPELFYRPFRSGGDPVGAESIPAR